VPILVGQRLARVKLNCVEFEGFLAAAGPQRFDGRAADDGEVEVQVQPLGFAPFDGGDQQPILHVMVGFVVAC
jgi:hypothetical protein